jgi:hypothetical protein
MLSCGDRSPCDLRGIPFRRRFFSSRTLSAVPMSPSGIGPPSPDTAKQSRQISAREYPNTSNPGFEAHLPPSIAHKLLDSSVSWKSEPSHSRSSRFSLTMPSHGIVFALRAEKEVHAVLLPLRLTLDPENCLPLGRSEGSDRQIERNRSGVTMRAASIGIPPAFTKVYSKDIGVLCACPISPALTSRGSCQNSNLCAMAGEYVTNRFTEVEDYSKLLPRQSLSVITGGGSDIRALREGRTSRSNFRLSALRDGATQTEHHHPAGSSASR